MSGISSMHNTILNMGLTSLNETRPDHQLLLAEFHTIFLLLNAVRDHPDILKDNAPDLYSFGISGLAHIVDKYGANSPEAADAVRLVELSVDQLTAEFRRMYGESVMVELVRMAPVDARQVRKVRSLMQATPMPLPSSDVDKYNLAPVYSPMYPIAFNIILWVMVGFALTVFAVSLGLWYMDPGRDSIIYRMTSQRIKKD